MKLSQIKRALRASGARELLNAGALLGKVHRSADILAAINTVAVRGRPRALLVLTSDALYVLGPRTSSAIAMDAVDGVELELGSKFNELIIRTADGDSPAFLLNGGGTFFDSLEAHVANRNPGLKPGQAVGAVSDEQAAGSEVDPEVELSEARRREIEAEERYRHAVRASLAASATDDKKNTQPAQQVSHGPASVVRQANDPKKQDPVSKKKEPKPRNNFVGFLVLIVIGFIVFVRISHYINNNEDLPDQTVVAETVTAEELLPYEGNSVIFNAITGDVYSPGELAPASVVNRHQSSAPAEVEESPDTAATSTGAPDPASIEEVEFSFTSDPSGAELMIDGVLVGTTPFTGSAVPGTVLDYQVIAAEPYEEYDLYRPYHGTLTVPESGTAVNVWIERTSAEEQAAQFTYSSESGLPIPPRGQSITATPDYIINFIANELEVRDTPCPARPFSPMICAFTSDGPELVEITIDVLFEVYLQPAERTARWQTDPATGSRIALFTRPEGSYAFSYRSGTISMAFLGN